MIVCPSCGANLKFNPKTQRMQCDFCGSDFDPKEFEVQHDAQEQTVATQEMSDDTEADEDTYNVTIFTCPQCGGELMSVDDNTAAAFCSFCGASTILNARIAKEKRPEYIIPFSKTKEECKEAYMRLVKKALFIPKEYTSRECIDGFRGIYMPYWSYDVEQKGPVRLKGETSHRRGDYIITDHYDLKGNLDASYEGISFDASSSFSDSISEALAPFDVTKRVPFMPSYMSGYYADTADVDKEVYSRHASGTAYDISRDRILAETREFRKYSIKDENRPEGKRAPGGCFDSRTVKGHASMYPIWFMSYRNGDRVTYATVNGQTGKVAADLPIDFKKYLIWSAALAALIFAALNMMVVLKPSVLLVIASILTVIVFLINGMQRADIEKAITGEDDRGLQYIKNKVRLSRTQNGKKSFMENKGQLPGKEEIPETKMDTLECCMLFAGIISVAVAVMMIFFLKIVRDEPYYVMCIIDAVIFMLSFKYTLRNYNLMATRRLPQFDRKGGDDRA